MSLQTEKGALNVNIKRLLIIVATSLSVVAFPSGFGSAKADTGRPWQCTASNVNFYNYPASVAEACGLIVIPLDHVSTRPDGGTDRVYGTDGNQVTTPLPPAGFDPAKATEEQLRVYGYTPRPSDPDQVSAWRAHALQLRQAPSLPFVLRVPLPTLGGGQSPCIPVDLCWSGYVNDQNTFTTAYLDYTEPNQAATSCSGDTLATWVGIGGYGGGSLAQAGTLPHVGGNIADHTQFYQIWPSEAITLGFYQSPAGDDIQVHVWWYGNPGGWEFRVTDATRNLTQGWLDPNVAYDGTTAEYIAERVQYGNTISPLRNFWNGFWVNSAQANNIGMQNFHNFPLYMHTKAGTPLATPSGLTQDHFSEAWNACG